jgi:hypothetical protein
MAGTIATGHTLAIRQTVVGYNDGNADMYIGFLLSCDGPNGACGTHFAASSTLGSAETSLK